ncbi:zincin-like metallopeptidase domain-containing protein [Bradyrhizobium cenepequi]|uniref:zincin-like metallopeptidase domain-containing protein n=1 Tax=Bradyrhizobium cenepequi TaxID=2821403 RepID=UPI001CE2AF69|nr:zincin-like metallopeptidase domain-containing protein [Bradyrhizobium cenepequi]
MAGTPQAQLITPQTVEGHDGRSYCPHGTRTFTIAGSDIFDPRLVRPGSSPLCAEFSIDGDLRHAGYIQNWIGLLKADSRAFFAACSQASKAADYLRHIALTEPADVAA